MCWVGRTIILLEMRMLMLMVSRFGVAAGAGRLSKRRTSCTVCASALGDTSLQVYRI